MVHFNLEPGVRVRLVTAEGWLRVPVDPVGRRSEVRFVPAGECATIDCRLDEGWFYTVRLKTGVIARVSASFIRPLDAIESLAELDAHEACLSDRIADE